MPKHAKFSEKELLEGLTQKLRAHSEQHFGPGSKLNQQILRKILQVYTEASGLGNIDLIKKEGDHFIRLKPKVLGPWKTIEALEGAY